MKKSLPQDRSRRIRRFDSDVIERISIEILTFIAEDDERVGRFFDLTGLTFQTLRQVAGTKGFNSSLFDYLGSDEGLLRAFAERRGYEPEEVDAARMSLDAPTSDV